MIAAHLGTMRGGEFALHFLREVGKFSARAYAFDERQVAVVNRLPVPRRHVFRPEMVRVAAATLRDTSAAIRRAGARERARDRESFPVGDFSEFDCRSVQIQRAAMCDSFAVGRPIGSRDGRMRAAVERSRLFLFQIHLHQFATVIGQHNFRSFRRDLDVERAADVE